MKFMYARVSSVGQNLDRQVENAPEGIERIYEEKASGKNANERPQLNAMLETIRTGDSVVCLSLDRLARNVKDLLTIVETITSKGATIEFIKEHLTFSPAGTNPISNLMLQILGSIAEFERSLIKERQLQGIAIAKAKGKFKGGQKKLADEQVVELKDMAARRERITAIAKKFKISRPCVYSYIRA